MPRSVLLGSVFPLGVLLPAILAAGCTSHVPHADGPAGPVTAAPRPSASTVPLPTGSGASPSTSTGQPQPSRSTDHPSPLILGPNGFGALKLGMTDAQATATGLIAAWNTTGRCHYSRLKAARSDAEGVVEASAQTGVNTIGGISGVRTPEGIHVGSSRAQVVKAYPDWVGGVPQNQDPQGNGLGFGAVPGNRKASYRIVIKNGKVTEVDLELNNQNCYE